MIQYEGMEALATSHHCQFVGYVGRIRPLLKWDKDAMADEKPFDRAIDGAGMLRLCTMQRYSQHIGNILDDGIVRCAKEDGLL